MDKKKTCRDGKLQGVCMTMCPTQERIMRMRENLYHTLECKIHESGKRTKFPDPLKFVKEYARPAADQTISHFAVRPLPILKRTINYLLTHVTHCEDITWREVFDFISDRLRAIHKDIIVQDLFVEDALDVLAPIARFHIYALYRLCECNHPELDSFLNLKQLNHALLDINSIFKEENYIISKVIGSNNGNIEYISSHRVVPPPEMLFSPTRCKEEVHHAVYQVPISKAHPKANYSFDDICDKMEYLAIFSESEDDSLNDSCGLDPAGPRDEASLNEISHYSIVEEMLSLYLLVNLGSEEAIRRALELPVHVRNGNLLRKVLDSCIWWLTGNYFPLLRLVSTLPPLFCCAIHLHLNKIQRHALGVLSVAHNSPNLMYSLKDLQKSLLSSSDAVRDACSQYGLSISNDEVQFKKGNFNWEAPLMKPVKADWLDAKLASVSIDEILLPLISD